MPTRPRPRRLRRHAFHAQGRASTPSPATSAPLPSSRHLGCTAPPCRRAAGRLNSGSSAPLPLTSRRRHCPTSLIQQQGCSNAITPPRTRRPNRHCRRTSSACASLRPAEPPSRSYKETPPRSPRHHAPPSLLPPSPLPRSAATRVAHLPPLFLRRGKSPSSISLSEPPLPKVSPGRASPSTPLSPYALGFENGGRNQPTTEAPVSFAASHGGRARGARAPVSPCPSISLSVFFLPRIRTLIDPIGL
jgi:hypothetical protein